MRDFQVGRGLWLLAVLATLVQARLMASEFKPLFNGTDLSGWIEMGKPGAFVADGGSLFLKTPQNHPDWLRTEKEYENFVLKLQYMVLDWCETGVFIHAPLYGDPIQSGLKLHLKHDRSAEEARSTGAIYDVVSPIAFANKGPNEWNSIEIYMDWPTLRVKLNDVVIQDLNMDLSDALRLRARRGFIGLEDLGFQVRYRNIEIRELPDKDRKWTSLFNGTDLKGWTRQGNAKWVVQDGKINGSNGDGFLLTEESFGSFEFQTYFRTSPHANGGIYFRRSGGFGGYEIQIYNVPGSTNPTGSIYGRVPAKPVPCRDGEWGQLRIVSDGAYTGVWVNGWKVAESYSMRQPDNGKLAFQNHSDGQVEYFDPKIRPLR
jgi:hypothetical protein